VLDIGAHVGLFALKVLSQTADTRLIAVEPASRTCALLRANVAESGLGARVRIVRAAAGSSLLPERVRLRCYPNLTSNATCAPAERERAQGHALAPWRLAGAEDELCPTTTISRLLADERLGLAAERAQEPRLAARVRLLKVDVEGLELDVLRGVAPSDWPQIEQVVVEAHAVGDRVEQIVALLRDVGRFECLHAEPEPELAELGLDNWLVYARRDVARR
jgi:FkbM family methyltransferase